MPFKSYEINEVNTAIKEDDNESGQTQDLPPVFIIPGVLGNGAETTLLAEELSKLALGKLFVWDDPRLINAEMPNNTQFSIDSQAKDIAANIPVAPFKSYPIVLIGYSYGCTIAAPACQYLQDKGYAPHLILIDGPSEKALYSYFITKKTLAVYDLFQAFNAAAKNSGLTAQEPEKDLLQKLEQKSLAEQSAILEGYFIDKSNNAPAEFIEQFRIFTEIITTNLSNIYHAQNQALELEPLEKIHLILTKETQQKFEDVGWGGYTKQIDIIYDPDLKDQTHTELLANPQSCARIAQLIGTIFSHEIKKEDYHVNEINYYLSELKKKKPDLDFRYILEKILNGQKEFLANEQSTLTGASNSIYPAISVNLSKDEMLIDEFVNEPESFLTPMDNVSSASTFYNESEDEHKEKSKNKNHFSLFSRRDETNEDKNLSAVNTRKCDEERASFHP